MAKSMRSKWRRKMVAVKRKRLEPKMAMRLQKTITSEHIPTIPEIEGLSNLMLRVSCAHNGPLLFLILIQL